MISDALLASVECPDCGGSIARTAGAASCAQCRREFDASHGYLDLRPREAFAEETRYLDEAFHRDARHETVAPPLLGSKIRNDMLRKFLRLQPGDRAVDLGCGSGRTIVWNAETGARLSGIDVSPFFATDALERSDLVRGDLRRLPFRAGTFNKAWSLDVLEHLSPAALDDVLGEAHRVLDEGGAFFIYTHVRRNGWIAGGVRAVNRLAGWCERVGLVDLGQERLRKSDHVNPLADHNDLRRVVSRAGFRLERMIYYTPIVGAFVENVLVRMAERVLTRRAAREMGAAGPDAARQSARRSAQARVKRGGTTYLALAGLSALMKIDVVLFGRLVSGPFFALLRKQGATGARLSAAGARNRPEPGAKSQAPRARR
jgi:SAM-dependent methyltransferase